MPPLAQVAGKHGREIGIALCRDDTQSVTNRPQHQAGNPLLEPKTEGRRDGAVDDRECARRSAQKDRLGERAVDRRLEPFEMMR